MLTLPILLESLLCLQQALIRRLPHEKVHHTPQGDTALPAEGTISSYRWGEGNRSHLSATSIKLSKSGEPEPSASAAPRTWRHRDTWPTVPQGEHLLRRTKSNLQSSKNTRKVIPSISQGGLGNREERTSPEAQQDNGVSLHWVKSRTERARGK